MFEGICAGGPMDGHTVESRYPKGFLLIDRPVALCWLYEYDDGQFICRDSEPDTLYDEGPRNRWRAAEEGNYDVLAAPWLGEETT